MMAHRKPAAETRYNFKSAPDRPLRVGLYSGSFDPVHAGHLSFSLQAQKVIGLDHILFVPERRPLTNPEAEHYAHRAAMVERALKPYDQFSLLDLPDKRLTLQSLPRIYRLLPADTELHLLIGADELLERKAAALPHIVQQLALIIAVTSDEQLAQVLAHLNASPACFRSLQFVDIGRRRISSSMIRGALRQGQKARGLLPSVHRYVRRQWLYLALK
jgi:nicotinate-nucleotide adenylyltransferase